MKFDISIARMMIPLGTSWVLRAYDSFLRICDLRCSECRSMMATNPIARTRVTKSKVYSSANYFIRIITF
jgi:hypothetical protein